MQRQTSSSLWALHKLSRATAQTAVWCAVSQAGAQPCGVGTPIVAQAVAHSDSLPACLPVDGISGAAPCGCLLAHARRLLCVTCTGTMRASKHWHACFPRLQGAARKHRPPADAVSRIRHPDVLLAACTFLHPAPMPPTSVHSCRAAKHMNASLAVQLPKPQAGWSACVFRHTRLQCTHVAQVQGGSQIVMDTIGWQDLRVDVTQHNVTEVRVQCHQFEQSCECETRANAQPLLAAARPARPVILSVTIPSAASQDYFSSGCRSHLHRLLIDVPAARTLSCTRLLRRTLEFPNMNKAATARPHQHAYFASDAVDDEVAWAPAQVCGRMICLCSRK